MKISGYIKNYVPPSVRWDILFLSALFLFNCFTFSSWWPPSKFVTSPWLLLAWLYGLVMLVPLAWRDKTPLPVFATQCVLTAAAWPFLNLYTPIAGVPVALYAVSVHHNKKISLLALLTSLVPNGLAAAVAFKVYDIPDKEISSFVQNSLFLVLVTGTAWALGRGIQASKRRVQHLESEKKRAQEAVGEERRRIAAELHDIVCHAVTLIILQAAGAARVAKTDLAEVIQALRNIECQGTQAMAELQRLLGVLRGEDPTAHTTSPNGLKPQPGLANLPELLESLRAAIGKQVTHQVDGTPRDLDPSVDLAAYRIVQEGLTNILRHAGEHASPQLRLAWRADTLLIQIDNGTKAKANHAEGTSGGRGLVGLRERVHAVGGHLEAGPHRGAGYRLTATLPLATQPGVPLSTMPRTSGQDHGN